MEPFTLIIFGITGNLAQIKLIPALYDIAEKGLLPKDTSIIGIARSPKSESEFKEYLEGVLKLENKHHKHEIKEKIATELFNKMSYINGSLDDPKSYQKLKEKLKDSKNVIFYLATYPDLYEPIFENLKQSGLSDQASGWVRLMIEKPIGNNLESAKKLNQLLKEYFTEDQIFRLDHYLGKETLQNILTFRFGNDIFEPMINKDHIDHIQITAAENFGVGSRGGYYDSVGALKDVGQNHLLQMLAFATMDAPSEFTNESVTKERIKILESIVPIPQQLVLGQYEGYKNEANIDHNSKKDTYFAFKTEINNDRLRGVPIYIRGGKMLKEYVTEIAIVFKAPSNRLFSKCLVVDHKHHQDCVPESNVLIYRIQPNEGIVLKILSKKAGFDTQMESKFMEFCYRPDMKTEEGKQSVSSHFLLDPYERLIFDAIKGDQTFFNDAEEVEAEWAFVDRLSVVSHQPSVYEPGSWGPKEADEMMEKDGREWLEPSMDFCKI